MTVRELIEKLQMLDQEAKVVAVNLTIDDQDEESDETVVIVLKD